MVILPAQPVADTSGRRRLLDAAIAEFSERGFDGASALSIARRAGVKQPLLNYHFGGKDGLWRAVLEEAYAEATQALDALKARHGDDDPLSRLREVAQPGPRLDWLVEAYLRPLAM